MKHHYSDKVGDFTPCNAQYNCPYGDESEHVDLPEDMPVHEWNKIREDFLEDRYGNGLESVSRGSSSGRSLPSFDKDEANRPSNARKYSVTYDSSKNPNAYLKPGSTFKTDGEVHQVKSMTWDRDWNTITVKTTDGETVEMDDEDGAFTMTPAELLKNTDDPSEFIPYNAVTLTKPTSPADLKEGDVYETSENLGMRVALSVEPYEWGGATVQYRDFDGREGEDYIDTAVAFTPEEY